MAKRIKQTTKEYLTSVALPNHADTYTVISHESIIDYAYQELANQGFGIVDEEYRCTHDGQIAQGIYRLQYNSDPEMSIMFAWTNSYNKQIRFKCVTGAYIHSNSTVMILGELGNYARKHTGTADADTIASMQSQITNATMYYNQLVYDKEMMKTVNLTSRKQAELLGILFAEYEILNTEQASIIRTQMDKPGFFYNGGKDTLWAFYNHVTVALQQSHPRTWMEDQRMLHWIINNEFQLSATIPVNVIIGTETVVDPLYVDPGQTNILDQIADLEADQMDEDIRYAASEDIEIHIESDQEYLERVAEIEGEPEVINLDAEEDEDWDQLQEAGVVTPIVQYTDPVGNTFEAPVVDKTFVDNLSEAISDKFETEAEAFAWEVPTLEPTPEEYELFEADEKELEELKVKLEAREIRTIATEILKEEENDDFNFDLSSNDNEKDTTDDFFL